MRCASCGTRKARRGCPALAASICPTCCGTKRLTEIACPDDCGWLRTTAAHPAAAVQRQAEDDQRRLHELLGGLSEPEYVVLTACLQAAQEHRRGALPAPYDADLRAAAAALRQTYETEARGVLYEHRPDSMVAARLADALREALDRLSADGLPRLPVHVPPALRRIERLATPDSDATSTAFLDFLGRVLRPNQDGERRGRDLAASALRQLEER